MTSVTPSYLLHLFRQGRDTYDLALLPEVCEAFPKNHHNDREAEVVRLISYARDREIADRELSKRMAL